MGGVVDGVGGRVWAHLADDVQELGVGDEGVAAGDEGVVAELEGGQQLLCSVGGVAGVNRDNR